MAGQKSLPHGTTVTFASASIGGLEDVSLPDRSKGSVETTDHDSGFDRTYLPGLRDNGQVTVTCQRVDGDAGQQALEDNFEADRTTEEMVITLPAEATDDSTVATFTFDGFVLSIDGDNLPAGQDEPAMFTAVVKVTGAVTHATA